jgi:hypothetical protein
MVSHDRSLSGSNLYAVCMLNSAVWLGVSHEEKRLVKLDRLFLRTGSVLVTVVLSSGPESTGTRRWVEQWTASLPPRAGKQNERFRDLVDLLLMDAIRAACELVFRNRSTHAWPPDLSTVPAHWAQPFARLAEELELVETDLEAAILRVRNFVARILDSAS